MSRSLGLSLKKIVSPGWWSSWLASSETTRAARAACTHMVHVLGSSDPADAAYSVTGFRRLPYSRTSTTRVPAPRSAPRRDHEANRRPSAPAQPTCTGPSLPSFLQASNPPARPPIGCCPALVSRRAGRGSQQQPVANLAQKYRGGLIFTFFFFLSFSFSSSPLPLHCFFQKIKEGLRGYPWILER